MFCPRHCAPLLGLALLTLLAFVPARASVSPPPWNGGGVVTALCDEGHGRFAAATEGGGIWTYDGTGHYDHFTAEDGLGSDDVYALCHDAAGRLWAGTLHGLSVYNGSQWKTYGLAEGVGGSRIFALAVCPTDGDVWIATEGGLTRYSLHRQSWTQFSRREGLPSDALSCLAFSREGDLYVGTQADGVAIASPADSYRTWRVVPGPVRSPAAPSGAGLPSALINCLLVTNAGVVYAGTDDGLAHSEDKGETWRYLRGTDWKAKAGGEAVLVDNADLRALEVLPVGAAHDPPVRIHAGGGAVGIFAADTDFDGGSTASTGDAIDTSAVRDPAPQEAYRTARWGSFLYTIPHLRPAGRYRVRLHLTEAAFDHAGQRVFNVMANDKPALTQFDIFAEAGGRDKAIVREFLAAADAQGRIVLTFQGATPLASHASAFALREDYVTCLAGDGAGHLWVGHRDQGMEALSLQTGTRLFPSANEAEPTDFVLSVLPRPDGTLLVAGHGGGLISQPLPSLLPVTPAIAPQAASAPPPVPAPLPPVASPPTLAELNSLLREVSAIPPDKHETQAHVVALDDDWQTEGDWLGRYGRYWSCFPACCSPDDYYWGAGWENISYSAQMGPNCAPDDSLRYWVQTLYTDEAHCLEMPPTYLDSRIKKGLTDGRAPRRDSSQDDHSETYPRWLDGPHIYQTVSVPAGLYVLSLYFFTRQDNATGSRDFRLSVRPHPQNAALSDIGSFATQPEWAHGRVFAHFGGVWKRFLVRGPQAVTVEVNRNHSWNTEFDGITLDLVDELPPPYFGTVDQWEEVQAHQEEQRQQAKSRGRIALFQPAATEQEAASRLLDTLGEAQFMNSEWWSVDSRQFYAALLRWYTQAAGHLSKEQQAAFDRHLATCCYQMGQYQQWEGEQKRVGLTPARDVEKALRWDGISSDGQGYQVVMDYLALQHDKKISHR